MCRDRYGESPISVHMEATLCTNQGKWWKR